LTTLSQIGFFSLSVKAKKWPPLSMAEKPWPHWNDITATTGTESRQLSMAEKPWPHWNYDSLFLAAAERESVPLLTLDKILHDRVKETRDVRLVRLDKDRGTIRPAPGG
jgi:hypothetical protein